MKKLVLKKQELSQPKKTEKMQQISHDNMKRIIFTAKCTITNLVLGILVIYQIEVCNYPPPQFQKLLMANLNRPTNQT